MYQRRGSKEIYKVRLGNEYDELGRLMSSSREEMTTKEHHAFHLRIPTARDLAKLLHEAATFIGRLAAFIPKKATLVSLFRQLVQKRYADTSPTEASSVNDHDLES